MGLTEKLAGARKTNWLTEDFSEAEVKTVVELAKISATIERRRLEMGMTQKQFADYMGVTQSMVSKWESREYNFTIKSLNDICQKLNLELSVGLEKKGAPIEYNLIKWDTDKAMAHKSNNVWMTRLTIEEAIA